MNVASVIVTGNFVQINYAPDTKGLGAGHSMTLEQYSKHALDPAFAAAVAAAAAPADKALLVAAAAALPAAL